MEFELQLWPDLRLLCVAIILWVVWLWVRKPGNSEKKSIFNDPYAKWALPIIERDNIAGGARRYRFGLPSPDYICGLERAQHIHITAKINDKLVTRCFFPFSDSTDNFIDLLVKVYKKDHPLFPDAMSQYLESLKIGDTVEVSVPFDHTLGGMTKNCMGNIPM